MRLCAFIARRVVTKSTIIPMHSRRSETAYRVERNEFLFVTATPKGEGERKGDGNGEGKIKGRGTRE